MSKQTSNKFSPEVQGGGRRSGCTGGLAARPRKSLQKSDWFARASGNVLWKAAVDCYGMKWVVDGYPFEGRETVTPLREDFDVVVRASGVDVTFKPTQSEYSFSRLVNAEDIERYGPISDVPRHAATGNTGRYDTAEVAQMAFDLASSAAKAAWR